MGSCVRMPPYDDRYLPPYHSIELILLTVDKGGMRVVLTEGRDYLPGNLVLPGVLVFERKNFDELVRRLLSQLFGLYDLPFEQIGTFSEPDRVPGARVVSTAHLALIEADRLREVLDQRPDFHLATVNFHPFVYLSTLHIGGSRIEAGFDHESIIAAAVKWLRERLDHTLLGFQLVPETFTMLQLQEIHETVLGEPLDKALFRKRMLARAFPRQRRLEKTVGKLAGNHRPAALYRLSEEN